MFTEQNFLPFQNCQWNFGDITFVETKYYKLYAFDWTNITPTQLMILNPDFILLKNF